MRVATNRVQCVQDAMRPHVNQDMDLIEVHAIISGPGQGRSQPVHVDTPEYDGEGQLVHLPLQYTDRNNGQTEFEVDGQLQTPTTNLGEVLILDPCIRHRGVPNLGTEPRVILHLHYHKRGVEQRKWKNDFPYSTCRRLKSRVFEVSLVDPFFHQSDAVRKAFSKELVSA